MLTHLTIQHLTLIDELDLEFHTGMSVVTGETGAGKSIILGALGLALGDRADSSLIATHHKKAEISASFDLNDNAQAGQWLSEKELDDDGHCILRRVISRDGRSRAFVNGRTVTLAELRVLGEMLLDIHTQHEHQSLLKKDTHRRLLDEFGGLTDVAFRLGGLFETYTQLQTALEQMRNDAAEQSARVQLLSYQVEELNLLGVGEDETSLLEAEQKRLSSADTTRATLIEALQLCCNDEDGGTSALMSRTLKTLGKIDDNRAQSIRELISVALIQIDEASADLALMIDQLEENPERLLIIEDRLTKIYDIARKHKLAPDELAALTERLSGELDQIINVDERIASINEQLIKARSGYDTLAEKLTRSRVKTAELLNADVTEQLQRLGMAGANFTVAIGESHIPHRHGGDDIEFLITTNPGQAPNSLNKIASGGELSRISLAIQVVTAKTSKTPTLVFDEVDVGVGGATAEIVGSLLRRLGADAQLICVTHLPQVAAQSHHHYTVTKTTGAAGASTRVDKLNEEQIVNEIARMLGGVQQTEQSIAHAVSMIAGAKH